MSSPKKSRLKRPIHPMPGFVREALEERGLVEAYDARPPYQRNDYVGWISRAKREATQHKRLAQMLDELERGDVYMKMAYRPKRSARALSASSDEAVARRSSPASPKPALDQEGVIEIALELPETSLSSHRGRPDIRVRNKIFVTLPEDGATINLKTTADDLDALVAVAPETFRDVWGGKWVGVDLARAHPEQLRELIVDAWRLAAPKRLVYDFTQEP